MQNTLPNYITSVDELTCQRWSKCLRGNYTALRRVINDGNEEDDAKAWRMFLEDHLTEIGLNAQQKKFQALKTANADAILKYVGEDPDSSMKDMLYNDVEQTEDELNYFLKQYDSKTQPKVSIEQNCVELSNHHKRTISARETTVLEYHYLTTSV